MKFVGVTRQFKDPIYETGTTVALKNNDFNFRVVDNKGKEYFTQIRDYWQDYEIGDKIYIVNSDRFGIALSSYDKQFCIRKEEIK